MKHRALFYLTIASAICGTPLHADDQNWPAWRGAGEDGFAEAGKFPGELSDKTLVWKLDLPDRGCSTPIVWGDQIILTGPKEGQDTVFAVDWKGKVLWETPIGKERAGRHRNGSGSNPSAVTNGSDLVVYFKSGNLAALDLDGKVRWTTNLQERFGKDTLYWDLGTSPVLTKDHAVVAVMHGGESFLAAFDPKSGDMAWKQARQYETPVENDHSYTTPIILDNEDGSQTILVWGAEHLTAHNATNGELIWESGNFNPEGNKNWVAVASHVVSSSGDIAVVPYGRGSRMAGVKIGGKGDVTSTNRAWDLENMGAFCPTPIAASNNRIILVRDQKKDRGTVVCLDASTGKTQWTHDLPRASKTFYGSPTLAGDRLYIPREDGVVFVADLVEDGLNVLSENAFGEQVIASPVPVRDHVLIRSASALHCFAAR